MHAFSVDDARLSDAIAHYAPTVSIVNLGVDADWLAAPRHTFSSAFGATGDEGTGREKTASYFSFSGLLHSAYSSSSTAIARAAADGTR
jgi:hypothetical protein